MIFFANIGDFPPSSSAEQKWPDGYDGPFFRKIPKIGSDEDYVGTEIIVDSNSCSSFIDRKAVEEAQKELQRQQQQNKECAHCEKCFGSEDDAQHQDDSQQKELDDADEPDADEDSQEEFGIEEFEEDDATDEGGGEEGQGKLF